MSLRDPDRAGSAFEVDEPVRRILAAWGAERDSDIGRLNLSRASKKLRPEQQIQLRQRLAEVSLGVLFTIEQSPNG